jgi:hypothetical protein
MGLIVWAGGLIVGVLLVGFMFLPFPLLVLALGGGGGILRKRLRFRGFGSVGLEWLTPQNIGALVLIIGEALVKYATPEFTWGQYVTAAVLTVLGWFGLNNQASYHRRRLKLEDERVALLRRQAHPSRN